MEKALHTVEENACMNISDKGLAKKVSPGTSKHLKYVQHPNSSGKQALPPQTDINMCC